MKVTKSTRITEEICSGISTQQNLRYVKHIELDYKQHYLSLSMTPNLSNAESDSKLNKQGQSHKYSAAINLL